MNIVIIGAHPDDPEGMLGGITVKFRKKGHRVLLLSMTDGSAGHHKIPRDDLRKIRAEEAKNAAAVLDAEYDIMPFIDGELFPAIENRNKLIKKLRKFAPDLVFTHPMVDYHPDHRYTCQLVMDTSYMLNVPAIAPEIDPPAKHPAYFFVASEKSEGALAFGIDNEWELKVRAWDCHASQMYEWLPWIGGYEKQVPSDRKERVKWLSGQRAQGHMLIADRFRGSLGKDVRCAEAVVPAPIGRKLATHEAENLKGILDNGQKT